MAIDKKLTWFLLQRSPTSFSVIPEKLKDGCCLGLEDGFHNLPVESITATTMVA